MSYQISNISSISPSQYPVYFFDANVWIFILKYNQTTTIEKNLQPYIDFFEAIINLNSFTDPKIVKKIGVVPKIAITNMLLSEIINAYLRNVAMPSFLCCKPGEKNFKKDYRDFIHSDYDKQLKLIVSDIEAYSQFFNFYDDDFSSMNPIDFIKNLDRSTDYNDMYYADQMRNLGIPIVTHDSDFVIEDIEIISNHTELLKLSKKT